MTNKELNEAVFKKVDSEYDAFLDEVNDAFENKVNSRYPLDHGDEFLAEYAFRYNAYGDILMALDDMELPDDQCNALLNSSNSLDMIYEEWLDMETGYMDDISDCIKYSAEKEVNIRAREKRVHGEPFFQTKLTKKKMVPKMDTIFQMMNT